MTNQILLQLVAGVVGTRVEAHEPSPTRVPSKGYSSVARMVGLHLGAMVRGDRIRSTKFLVNTGPTGRRMVDWITVDESNDQSSP